MTKKILIVEDETDMALLVESRLKASGYDVISVGDGQAGFEMAKKEKPDLMILDLMLPKMDGHKVCGLLKKDTRYAKIPIILFTARAQEGDRKLGEEAGADAYITKPFEAKVLLDKIRELLGD
ncbi:MAG: response regulator [Candidatus Omnitrophica bacterium]|nr:response regulator [Candidatus Omnitrophota bacterium]